MQSKGSLQRLILVISFGQPPATIQQRSRILTPSLVTRNTLELSETVGIRRKEQGAE
jgi:hypothetical protein